jgi:two-component system chemotaxis response regulator CheB
MKAVSKRALPAGQRVRVLVVDDSAVIRRLIARALEQDADLEVVGSAPDGQAALEQIALLHPDVVTLDIEMPRMGGLDALRELRKTDRNIRAIVFSSLTERGASATIEALLLGADDYLTKTSSMASLDLAIDGLRHELIPKIRQFFSFGGESVAEGPAARIAPLAVSRWPQVVVIGVSTGGPAALDAIIPSIPADFPLPVLIVQHMPATFTRLLAERLNASSKIKVEEATEGAVVECGRVLIAPGGYHMRVRKQRWQTVVELDQGPPENACRPAADVLFRSAKEVYGSAVLAVVMTGMGCDGLKGAMALKSGGAAVIVQDEATSVVWGMAGGIANAGLADAVLPLHAIVPEILSRTARRNSPRLVGCAT